MIFSMFLIWQQINLPKLSVVLPDGTAETRDVSSIAWVGVVTVSSAFSQTPNAFHCRLVYKHK